MINAELSDLYMHSMILNPSFATLFAAERAGVHVVECACITEPPELKVWPYKKNSSA